MTPEELGDVTVLMGATNGKLPPCQVWWPLALCSGDIMVLACHVVSQGHLIKGSYDLMGRSPSR